MDLLLSRKIIEIFPSSGKGGEKVAPIWKMDGEKVPKLRLRYFQY